MGIQRKQVVYFCRLTKVKTFAAKWNANFSIKTICLRDFSFSCQFWRSCEHFYKSKIMTLTCLSIAFHGIFACFQFHVSKNEIIDTKCFLCFTPAYMREFMCLFCIRFSSNFIDIFGIESKDSLVSRVHYYYHDSIFTKVSRYFSAIVCITSARLDEENNILSSAFARSCLWENCYFICYRIRKFSHSKSHLIFFSIPMETLLLVSFFFFSLPSKSFGSEIKKFSFGVMSIVCTHFIWLKIKEKINLRCK